MVTKIKPYRIRDVNEPEEGNSLQYNDPNTFARGEGGGGGGGGEYTAGKGISIVGNVISNTLPGAVVSATAPSNPTAGTAWYDTTNGALKVYNGSAWETIATGGSISDTAYGSGWDGQTTTAPSQNAVYDKIESVEGEISTNTSAISTINGKIPSEATTSNQLADKEYVLNNINSVTAYYITKNAQGDQFATYAELAAATTFYSGGVVRVPTRNDYTIVLSDENHDNATTRYIYNSGWEYQYTINETPLTQAQLDALNSGITAAKVTNYDALNTKTFYLSSTSDLTNAQSAYDWYKAGKNPIIRISGWNYSFILEGNNSEPTYHLGFYGVNGGADNGISNSYIGINPRLELRYSSDTVTSVVVSGDNANVLFTDVNYSTPYTPQYDGSPATKKYVDDSVNWIEVNVATAYWTAAKVGTTTAGNYTPTKGDFLLVNFVDGCSVDNPTLDIDGSGAKAIRTGSANATKSTFALGATANSNIKALLYYDGTYYRCWSTTNSNTTYSAMSVSEGQTGTATSQRSMRADYLKQIIKYHSVSDTAYDSTWDGVTDIAPSKNAVYDKIESLSSSIPSSSATAPSNPTEGQLWYDTTNDVLKVYDGTNWDEVGSGGGETYNSGKGISIGNISRNDTQGPAPDGFHVPLDSEWIAVYNILITTFGLTANAATAGTYLKMPLAGNRDYYTGNLEDVGTWGDYWSATASSTTPNSYAYALHLGASTIEPDDESFRADANSIRCFKNTPVTPNSSWTTLYDGSSVATNAGIFRDRSNGYISISGDGSTWYTIQDKNLGASTVYNQGDTLTSANCGYLYQWGNNYGFPRTGSIATSTTKVDASNYGPTNYYSSSTFITVRSGSPMDWATTKNDDLRGGVSQSSWVENNAISNTGVLSVNGHTGDVIIDETIKQVPSSQDGMPQFTSDLYSYYEGNGTPYPFLIKDGYLYELKEVTSELDAQQGLTETMIYRRTASNNASICSQAVDSFPLYMLVYIMGSFDHADTTYSDFYTGEIKVGLPKWVINDSVDPAETVATQMNSIASFINKYGINSNASIMYNGNLYMKVTTYATEGNYRKVYFMSLSPTTQNYASGTSRTMNKLVIIYFTYDSSTDTYTYDHYTSNSVMNASPYVLATNVNYTTVYTPQYDGSPATKKYVDDSVSVVSGDSGTTYTIKVSNSAPASGTPNSTITFVI